MAKEIDTRVVEMEFKNKDFEKAIAVTLESIDELNKKLDTLNDINVKGFEEMTNAAKSVDFSSIISGIDQIASRFTILGTAAQRIREEIVDVFESAFRSVASTIDGVFDTIVNKGKTRSKNLSQAKFQLEALGVEWKQVYEDMDYAVTGTAYGIDEAALAASQFAASGVKLGTEMKTALRGISGVAAMTGRSYSEIARIFTKVAGSGRAMNTELQMISDRGLSAKKAIADYINDFELLGAGVRVAEADIEQLARQGEVSFDIFANAMDHAFGEHATAANELFEGAFANTQAALGRIGERFATPAYEAFRQILVNLIPVINDFKKSLDPVVEATELVLEGLKDIAVEALNNYGEDFELFGFTINIKQSVQSVIDWVADAFNGLATMLYSGEGGGGFLSVIGETLLDIFYNLYQILSSIKNGITDVFAPPTAGDFIYYIQRIHDFVEMLVMNETTLDNFERTVRGIAAAFGILHKIGAAVIDVFLYPLMEVFGFVADETLSLTANIGDFIYYLYQGLDVFTPLYTIFARFRAAVASVIVSFQKLTGLSLDDAMATFNRLFESLASLTETFGGGILSVFWGIGEALVWALEQLSALTSAMSSDASFKQYLDTLASQSKILSWIRDSIAKIKESFKQLTSGEITLKEFLGIDKLIEKFKWLDPLIEKFKEHYKSIFDPKNNNGELPADSFIAQFGQALKKAIFELKFEDIFGMIGAGFYAYWIKKSVEIKSAVAATFNNFVDVFQNLAEGINLSLVKMTKETNSEKILKIAAAVALLAASMYLLSNIQPDALVRSIGAIAALATILGILSIAIANLTKTTEKMDRSYNITETGVKSSSKTRSKGKGAKQTVIEKVVESIGQRCSDIKEEITKTIKDVAAVPSLLLSFGAAVLMIAISIKKLAEIASVDINAFDAAAMIVLTIIGFLVLITVVLTILVSELSEMEKFDSSNLTKLSGMILAMALAIQMITVPIIALSIVAHFLDQGELGVAVGIVLSALLVFTLIAFGFATFIDDTKIGGVMAGAGAMFILASAIAMLTVPLVALTGVIAAGGDLLGAVGTITIILAEMMGIVLLFGVLNGLLATAWPGMIAGTAAMLIMAIALNAMLVPISALVALSNFEGQLQDAILTINILIIVMGLVVVLFGAISGATSGLGAVGMIAGAAAMLIMAKALTAMLIPLAAMAALDASGHLEGALSGVAKGLLILGVAVAGVILLAPGLAILASIFVTFAAGIWLIGDAVFRVGKGLFDFVAAIGLLQEISLDGLAEKFTTAITSMIEGFRNALAGGKPKLVEGIMLLLDGGLAALVGSSGMIAEAIMVLLVDVISAIDRNAQQLGFHLGHALLDITYYAFLGVAGSLADIIAKAFGVEDTMISDFLIDRFMPKSEEKGFLDKIGDIFSGDKTKDTAKDAAGETGSESGEKLVNSAVEKVDSPESKNKVSDSVNSLFSGPFDSVDFNKVKDLGIDLGDSGVSGLESSLDIHGGKSGVGEDLANIFAGSYTDVLSSDMTLDKVKDAGILLGKTTGDGVAEGQDSHSPSKVAIKLGQFFTQGLLVGLGDGSELNSRAKENAVSMIDTMRGTLESGSVDELASTIAAISSMDDYDTNPTISPILDLTNVNSGFMELSSMFSNQRSLALATDAMVLQDAGRTLSYEIQNGRAENYSDGITGLRKDIQTLGDDIKGLQLVTDTGVLAGQLSKPMNKQLGSAVMMNRRGIR